MSGLISVIIPIYNREEYIEECINSVISQSYQDFEIIIIDDGSTDKSLKICRNIAKKEPRIRILKSGHKGVSAARNIGLDAADGEYVIFVDSDDVIHPTLLNDLAEGLNGTDAKIAGTNVVNISAAYWDKLEEYIANGSKSSTVEYKTNIEAINIMLSGPSPINLAGGTMLKRELIGETRFRTDLFIAEDFYFIYENLIKGADVVYLKPDRYFCRIHKKNSSWVYDFSGFFTRFERRRLVWESELSFGRTENANRQKSAAFSTFSQCAQKHEFADSDVKKMAAVLRKYKKDIAPVLPFKSKVCFYLFAFLPFTYFLIKKLRKNKGSVTNVG